MPRSLKETRMNAGLPRIKAAFLANVSAFRLYQAEAGMIELRPDEQERLDKVLAPAYEERIRSAMEFAEKANG